VSEAALATAKLQVVETSVVTRMPAATVAVVAARTDELLAPQPYRRASGVARRIIRRSDDGKARG